MRRQGEVLTVCGLAFLGLQAGCAPRSTVSWNYPHATTETLSQSPHEHYQSASDVADRDGKALAEDLDVLFMTDRPTRLTRWHDR
ncbi:MAG: hypothetical protein HY763_04810 [Planctomycetes bacterium]|nr:hypothetical protein [Planctomycetota bacterium]